MNPLIPRSIGLLTRPGAPGKQMGKYAAASMREAKLIPGILYGGRATEKLVCICDDELSKIRRDRQASLENTLYNYSLEDGESGILFPKQLSMDLLTQRSINVNFFRYDPVKGARMFIPFYFADQEKCPGIKRGGLLNKIYYRVTCHVTGIDIPPSIRVSLSNIDVGGRVRWSDLDIPDTIRLVGFTSGVDITVCTLIGKKSLINAAEGEAEASTAAKKAKK